MCAASVLDRPAEVRCESGQLRLWTVESAGGRVALPLSAEAALALYESLEGALIEAGVLPENARKLRLAAPDMLSALNKFEHWSFALGRPDAPCWALSRAARLKAGESPENLEATFA